MGDSVVVRLDGLSKSYGAHAHAVADLSLTVNTGEIYGFLGRNGAGKTTTMRMLVGLIRPSSGNGTLLGRPLGDPAALTGVGALIEAPAFQPHLSGRDNLRLLARYAGLADSRSDEALAHVGLGDRAASKFRTYSLGMKQRLGVASALLGRPELLILDEPTNGLDPAGMADMRDLVRSLVGRGHAIMLSSHLLGEVEQICDRVGIIHQGRLVAEGTLAEIHAKASGHATLRVRAEPVDAAVASLSGLRDLEVTRDGEFLDVSVHPHRAAEVNRRLVESGVAVSHLESRTRSLEDVFLGLTGDQAVSAAAEPTGVQT